MQYWQVEPDLAPTTAENLPAAQAVHKEDPPREYLPTSQGIQVDEELAPTTAENLPAVQFVHAALLLLSL